MNILAIDTSGPVCGVAILKDGKVCWEAAAMNKLNHSVSLMPMIEEAFSHTDMTPGSIDLFAAVKGPGSFTGVRIGISAVKALAHVKNKPCIGIDALEAMAHGAGYFDGVLCPIQDARAGQVYGAFFDGRTLERLMEDEALKIEEYCGKAESFGRSLLFLGDGMPVLRDKIASLLPEKAFFAPENLYYLHPAAAAVLALKKLPEQTDYLSISPLYLRPPRAEKQKNLVEHQHE